MTHYIEIPAINISFVNKFINSEDIKDELSQYLPDEIKEPVTKIILQAYGNTRQRNQHNNPITGYTISKGAGIQPGRSTVDSKLLRIPEEILREGEAKSPRTPQEGANKEDKIKAAIRFSITGETDREEQSEYKPEFAGEYLEGKRELKASKQDTLAKFVETKPIDNVKTNEKGSKILYRVGDKENPLAINDKFNENLSRMISGNLKIGHTFELGNPNPILRSAGLPDLPIQLNSSRLRAKSKQEEHPFDLSEIADLPLAVQNPLVVFRSATREGDFVILTDIQHKGEELCCGR